jgi:hypothetical protein
MAVLASSRLLVNAVRDGTQTKPMFANLYVPDEAPLEHRLGLSFEVGQRLDVTSCGGPMWTAVTPEQIVGEFPREIGNERLNIPVIFKAKVDGDCE